MGVVLRFGGRRAARGGDGGRAVRGSILLQDPRFIQAVLRGGVSRAGSRGGWILQSLTTDREQD